MSIELAGTVTIFGNHATVDAELIITSTDAITDDELTAISAVLDGATLV